MIRSNKTTDNCEARKYPVTLHSSDDGWISQVKQNNDSPACLIFVLKSDRISLEFNEILYPLELSRLRDWKQRSEDELSIILKEALDYVVAEKLIELIRNILARYSEVFAVMGSYPEY